MRYGLAFAIGTILVGLGTAEAAAQSPSLPRVGTRPPSYSPYLNLLRPGNSPGVNYYGLVRPEVQTRQSLLSLQSQVGANGQAISDLATSSNSLPTTGKTVGFMNYGRYFQNFNPGVGGGVGGVGGGVGSSSFGTLGGAGGNRPAIPAAPQPRR